MKNILLTAIVFAVAILSCDDSTKDLEEIRGIFKVYTGPEWQCGENTNSVCFSVRTALGENKTGIAILTPGFTDFSFSGSAKVETAEDLRQLDNRLVAIRYYNKGDDDSHWYSPVVKITLLQEDAELRRACSMR